jgi:PiT family inorganic phosphate transporter
VPSTYVDAHGGAYGLARVTATLLAVAAVVLIALAFDFTSAILGAEPTRRLMSVHCGVGLNIVAAWIFTIPGAALVAAVTYQLLNLAIPT